MATKINVKRGVKNLFFALALCALVFGIFAESVSSAANYNGRCKVQVYTYGYYPKRADGSNIYSKTYYAKLYTNIKVNDVVRANKYRTEVYVEPGTVHLTVIKKGYLDHTETFECYAGQFIKKDVEMKLNGCIVELRVRKGYGNGKYSARIYVDGRYLGKYYVRLFTVPLGEHTITAEGKDYKTVTRSIQCTDSNPTIPVDIMMEKYAKLSSLMAK